MISLLISVLGLSHCAMIPPIDEDSMREERAKLLNPTRILQTRSYLHQLRPVRNVYLPGFGSKERDHFDKKSLTNSENDDLPSNRELHANFKRGRNSAFKEFKPFFLTMYRSGFAPRKPNISNRGKNQPKSNLKDGLEKRQRPSSRSI